MRSAYFIGDDYSRTFSNLMPINFRKTWMKIYYKFTMKLLYFQKVYLGSNDSLLISIDNKIYLQNFLLYYIKARNLR